MICSTTYRSALSLVGAAILTLGSFSVLKASAPWEPNVERVRYSQSNLDEPQNAQRLYQRIGKAAERVCETHAGVGLDANARLHRCIDGAVATAVAEVNHPQLTALHSATIGRWQLASERAANPGI